jgi:hypothetical protein
MSGVALQKLLDYIGREVIGQDGEAHTDHHPEQTAGKETHEWKKEQGENHTHSEGFMTFIKA